MATKIGSSPKEVLIKCLNQDVTDSELKDLLTQFGPVASCYMPKDAAGKCRGHAFCSFESSSDAQKAIDQLNQTIWRGRRLIVCRDLSREERSRSINRKPESQPFATKSSQAELCVRNLCESVDHMMLRRLFDRFGRVTFAKVVTWPRGQSRGFGYVHFANPQHAVMAQHEMNGALFRQRMLEVVFADRQFHGPPAHNSHVEVPVERSASRQRYIGRRVPPDVDQTDSRTEASTAPFIQRRVPVPPKSRINLRKTVKQQEPTSCHRDDVRVAAPQPAIRTKSRPPRPSAPVKIPRDLALPPKKPTSAMILSAEAPERRRMFGDYIYFLLSTKWPDHASDITGIMLNTPYLELLQMLTDESDKKQFEQAAHRGYELIDAHRENVANEKIIQKFLELQGFAPEDAVDTKPSVFAASYTSYTPVGVAATSVVRSNDVLLPTANVEQMDQMTPLQLPQLANEDS